MAEQQPITTQRVEELRSSPGEGSISPGSQSSGSERTDRERQRQQEQERRRREVVSLFLFHFKFDCLQLCFSSWPIKLT